MTKVYLVNFANSDFYESQEKCNKSALKFGVNETISFTMDMIKDTDFYKENEELLKYKRWIGWGCWKPYIILEALKQIEEGDILVYADSGIKITDSLVPFVERCKKSKGIQLFNNQGLICKGWTKRDCFFYTNCDTPEYHNGRQVMGGFNLWKKNSLTLKFVSEWLKFCKDIRIITGDANKCGLPNFKDYTDHRGDQAILSLLAIKYKEDVDIVLEEDYTRFNPKYNSPTSYLFEVHRTKKRSPLKFLAWRIKMITPVSVKDRIKWFINNKIKK